MTPQRWQEISHIFQAAVVRDAAAREAFLDEACRHDPSLRPEVDALVAAHGEAGSFGETPLLMPQDVKRLAAGTRLGQFRIDALLGVGGMGEVYRATDTKLGRGVALKVLPDSVARDPDRLARLQREARVLATLNHPHIAAIYGIEDADGVPALVLELVEGKTLADIIDSDSRRAMAIADVLAVARQIAEALEAAHEKGIVHRDLKPANIVVQGTWPRVNVKVLDFGLAKAVESDVSEPSQTTIGTDPTREGMILGTPAYMSPEQARGLPVDKRTDIWAFGCVLYEMLTGRVAFAGATVTDTLAAILEREPDWSALPGETPAHIRRVMRRALQKDPSLRLRDMGDARIELLSDDEQPALHAPRQSGRRRGYWITAAAIAVLGAVASLVAWWSGIVRLSGDRTAAAPVFRQLTFRRGFVEMARFAADGKTIVYSASWEGHRTELYTGSIDGPESRPLGWPSAVLFAVSPTNEIALSLGCPGDIVGRGGCVGTLATAPLAGGAPRALASDIAFADWGPRGQLAVVRRGPGSDRLEFPEGRVILEGGRFNFLRVDPEGRRVAVVRMPQPGEERASLLVIEPDGTKRTLSTAWTVVTGVAWPPSGDEVWFSAVQGRVGTLQAVTLDGRERSVLRAPGSQRLHDISRDGSLLIAQFDRRSVTMVKAPNDEVEHTHSLFDNGAPDDLSEDGRLLLFTERGGAVGGRPTIFLGPTDGTTPPVRLGEGAALALSPDAAWVLAVRSASSQQQLVLVPTGAGNPVVLPRGSIELYDDSWASFFPDGRQVLFHGERRGEGIRAFVQDLAGGEPRPITPDLAYVGAGKISPDGQWVPETTNDPGGFRHMLYPVAGGTPRPIPGLRPEDTPIQWSADGSEIYTRTWVPDTSDLKTDIFRISLRTGARTPWRTIRVADRAGAFFPRGVILTRDGRAYAYNYPQMLQDLYLATGLK